MMIIVVFGKIRSGKTTVTDLILKYAKKHKISLRNKRFGGPIYESVKEFYAKHDLKFRKFRPMFDAMGQALSEHTSWEEDKLLTYFKEDFDPDEHIIVDDCRRKKQADFLRKHGAIFIQVRCDDNIRKKRCKSGEWTENHISDDDLIFYHKDYVIINKQSKRKLKKNVDTICKLIFGKIYE